MTADSNTIGVAPRGADVLRFGQEHPSLTALGDALDKSRVSESALRLTEDVLGVEVNDPHVLAAFVAQNLSVMRPQEYEAWISSMHRNFRTVFDLVGFDQRAGTAQFCALVQGVSIVKRRMEVSEAQELSLLALSLTLLKECNRKTTEFFYESHSGLTLKDVGLTRFMAGIPSDQLEVSVQRLAGSLRTATSAPLRAVELELALSGDLVPAIRVGGL
jgi:hypothetical protein